MVEAWAPVVRPRAHELVMQAVEDRILAGELRVGDPLPPERELASRLGVSRAGVREAVRVLEGQGVLRSRVGSGADAGTFVAALPDAALTRFLRLHVALANFAMTDVVEARIALERTAPQLAASHADDAALGEVAALVARMDDPHLDPLDFNDVDAEFHIAIATASGNRLVASLAVAIRGAVRESLLVAIDAAASWDPIAAELRWQHHGILAALRARDGERAASLVEAHIRYAAAALPA